MDPGRHPLVLAAMVAIAVAAEAAWLAPAALMDSCAARFTRGAVRLDNAEGTLWRGRGVLTAANARIPVAWDIELAPLLQGEARIRVRSGIGMDSPRGTLTIRPNGITLRDADLTLPAAVIGRALGDSGMGSVEGDVIGSTRELDLARGSSRGEARLVWRAARIGSIGNAMPLDLGEVRVGVIANGAVLSGPLANDGGSLALRGEWSLREEDGLALALRVAPRRPDQIELIRWLSAVGTVDGDGWRITWHLPLR